MLKYMILPTLTLTLAGLRSVGHGGAGQDRAGHGAAILFQSMQLRHIDNRINNRTDLYKALSLSLYPALSY